MFLLVIDWIMRTTTEGKKNRVQRTPWTQLEDLDYADDLALLSHNHDQKQGKITRLAATSERTRLKINRGKSKVMRFNTTNENPITVGGEQLEEVDSSKYLGSVIDKEGGTDVDVEARIGKARATCSETYGSRRKSGLKPSFASSIQMLNRFSFMGQRHGDAQKRHYKRSKHS